MSLTNKTELANLITDIQAIAENKLSAKEKQQLSSFFPIYFEEAEHADLRQFSSLDLFGAMAAHYSFSAKRSIGQHKARIYNPDFERDGWQSTHTVIEIINDDMPFLIDSIAMLLSRYNLNLHLLIHPVLSVERDKSGLIQQVKRTQDRSLPLESFIHVQIDRVSDLEILKNLEADLNRILTDIRLVVSDEPQMRERLSTISQELAQRQGADANQTEPSEAVDFLKWMDSRNFLFLGYCDYDLLRRDGQDSLKIVRNSGLGILRDQGDKEYSASFEQLPPELRELAYQPLLIILNKSQTRSNIHRSAYIDFVGIKRFNNKGEVIGERRFLGLYTAHAYQTLPKDIPILRQKIAAVIRNCDYVDNSYKAKTLSFVLENYPRDELFQIPVEVLGPIAEGIVSLQERPRVRLFVRTDRYHRYVSCLVYVPRDSFNTEIRLKIEKALLQAFQGSHAEFSVQISDSSLARVHYIIRTDTVKLVEFNVSEIETEIARLTRGWVEQLHQLLIETHGEEQGNVLFNRYRNAFPTAYREEFSIRNALSDIQNLETLSPTSPLSMKLYRPFHRNTSPFNLKLFHESQALSLSASLPILENMGIKVRDEHPYCIQRSDGSVAWISDFGLDVGQAEEQMASDEVQHDFQELLTHVLAKHCESDGFNRLALLAGLDWREISLLRALAKYLRQGGLTFSQNYIEQCLVNYPLITRSLVDLFLHRLDPKQLDEQKVSKLLNQIQQQLDNVANLDEDRIFNGFLSLILAIRRTNFWQKTAAGDFKPSMAFKLASNEIPFLPQPRPMFEIWVYSPRVEGVHLRGSKVARGGLRWSDRMEDFRTEVLGLVKAQMVKNAVIVPMGSKGGFVGKQLPSPADREAFLAEGVACYKIFISALLDVTDNLVNGTVVPPSDVRRLDADDPYLVVAADKGTATFSDIANGISAEYGFWLGDAFASGGSAGYDHKGMGITARGAWESVKRHFRHLGINTQEQDFTVVGIGDMAGDVFGNGMLLSEHICLKAAFNHLHIFLDPSPDAAKSYAERKRLFNLPRSSWHDYQRELISKGGGVFERSAKSIPLSAEIKAWLETEQDSMAPNELIHCLLKAKVDLLYNGGIGTYVKASTQSHADARDRANDPVRVDGRDIQARVVTEGGNLTCTQLGRVEFELATGGRIATDAIDNSAGVDCSDHEVNIKILLGAVIQAGDMTLKQRNVLLADMTAEVGQLVLRNNVLQTQILAIKRQESAAMLSTHARMITHMEKTGELNREIEYLPSETQINERRLARQGLTVPETAVLLSYSKISLDQAILATDVPDDPDFLSVLLNYFPKPLQQRFGEQMQQHQLKREIIANQLANQIINRMGTTFVFRMQEESPFSAGDIARAWWIACRVFDAEHLWGQIEALDNKIAAEQQVELMVLVRTLIERITRWVLRSKRPFSSVNAVIEQYANKVQLLLTNLAQLIASVDYAGVAQLEERLNQPGMPAALTQLLARLEFAVPLMDIIDIADNSKLSLEQVAQNYFQLGRTLQLDWLRDAITRLPRDNRWQSLARSALRDDLYRLHSNLSKLARQNGNDAANFAELWLQHRQPAVEVCAQMFAELQSFSNLDLAMLSAGMRELNNHLLS
ncbi:NAD-glutamate dehydrogenase [Neisseriaceae bacterium TC5R-5]|nr:NAD-glutamate dehydrogenase [Neisseriaceae bacterium TC5R-5]